ncbi:MAG: Universal stress protein family [Brockia lithotrophica]|uniref:Universal stress protein family n=1 Tax=Brockia lithotrophica TaxID=933949 RepID=A0A2T5G7N0_9BACL|nr:universal stress protein [Brockia lithotrophica]PTQ52182.1 MAG: Universal stress protein family [Brockia lithotrophica]
MFQRILVAYDGSEHAKRALETAASIARMTPGAELHVVHVVRFDPFEEGVFTEMQSFSSMSRSDYRGIVLKEGERRIEEAKKRLERESFAVHSAVLEGDPARRIVEYAEEKGIDLIVVGRRGLTMLQELFLGSVSHRIAQLAKCSILIAK